MADLFRRPLGLVLSAGGALGAWQAAALEALTARHGLVFDAVLGFSAGALTGSAYALGEMEQALRRWRTIDGGILRFSPRLFPLSLFSDRPLRDSVAYAVDDERAKARARCRLIVVSARVQRDRPAYALFTPGGRGGWDAPLSGHLAASCTIPYIFPPVSLDFRGEGLTLFDGGVPCREPFSFAELSDCKDVIVLEMVRPEEMGRAVQGVFAKIDQKARETVRRLIDQGVSSLKRIPQPPRVFRLPPSRILEFTQLSFKSRDLRDALALGESDAEAFMKNPADHLAP